MVLFSITSGIRVAEIELCVCNTRYQCFMEHQMCLFHQNYYNQSSADVRTMAGEGSETGTTYSRNTSTYLTGGRGISVF